ncbi:uncharacterized protein FIESC28_09966 [Fusarium coffeatum]|uniref:Uncharacterized protein n=1 Tax=Fusarium coffeatum TaxID=231269 RepID=A0A366QYP6_9HYPO|nr:uncharacterized protein FIESC28_09966 [Fusarium coffeatum]RBR09358.1 hypothetical protein FIESC28_09966 [Fusarium coffeatum]
MILAKPATIALWATLSLATALPGPLRPGQQHPIQSAVLGRISQQGCFSSIPTTIGSPKASSQNSWDSCSRRCRDEEHKPVALVSSSIQDMLNTIPLLCVELKSNLRVSRGIWAVMPAYPGRFRDMDVWLGIVLGDAINSARKGPPADMQVSDNKCDEKCRDTEDSCGGYDAEDGRNVYSIYDTGMPRDNDMLDAEESSVSSSTMGPSPTETATWSSSGLSRSMYKDTRTNTFAANETVAQIYQFIGTFNAYWQYLIHSVGWFGPKEDREVGKDLEL